MANVLITGASSGIGLAFARAYAQAGWTVFATCRNPEYATRLKGLASECDRVRIDPLDVAQGAAIDALALSLKAIPIDLLINNAGLMGPPLASQRLGDIAFEAAQAVMETNCFGALRIAQAFRPHLAASQHRKLVCVSSGNGSIAMSANDKQAGLYLYRASKAALNVVMATYSQDCASDGISVLLLSPGLVDSNFANGSGADLTGVPLISPEASVAQMMPLIDQHRPGPIAWLRYTGESVPW